MNNPIRIFLVDDSPYFLDVVRDFLQLQSFLTVVGTASDEQEALAKSLQSEPDVILLDLNLARCSGLELIPLFRQQLPQVKIIALTMMDAEGYSAAALQAGADGFVHKQTMSKTLIPTILEITGCGKSRSTSGDKNDPPPEASRGAACFINLAEHLPDLIYRYEFTPKRGFTYVNPSAQAMTGYSPEEYYADPDLGLKLVHPEDRYLLKDFAQGSHDFSTPVVLRWIRKDGAELWTEQRNVPIYDADGNLIAVEGIVRDITERKRAEDALGAAERFNVEALNSLSASIAILDEDGVILAVDRTWQNFARENGADPSAVSTGVNYLHVCDTATGSDSEEAMMAAAGIRAVMQGKQDFFSMEYPCHSPDEQRWFVMRVTRFAGEGPLRIVVAHENITERKRAEAEIRRHVRELETVNRISTAMRMSSSPEESLTIMLDEILNNFDIHHGSISLWDAESEQLTPFVARGWLTAITERPIRSGEGIFGTVFASGETHISDDFASDPLTLPESRVLLPHGWGGACIPIRSNEKVLGVMTLAVPSQNVLRREDVRLFETLAEIVGTAVHRMILNEEVQRHLEMLQGLRQIDMAIISGFDRHDTLEAILAQVISQLGVGAADILMLDTKANALRLGACQGFTIPMDELIVPIGKGFAGIAVSEKRIVSANLQSVCEVPEFHKLWQREGFLSYFAIPLIAKDRTIGVLETYQRSVFAPKKEWFNFFEMLAGQAAIALERAGLLEDLARTNAELMKAYDSTIEGWSRAMDLRDKETEGHTLRVTDLTLKLARSMGLPAEELVHIRRGALLHDIGKMGVPDSILLKPGPLSEEEWAIMRRHPQMAYEMLSCIEYLQPALDIPYCHHERWDGTGYPRGLKGEAIPLAARIFAVVDVWDALTSDRPYRRAWPEEKAREYIRAQAGVHFDPRIVELFSRVVDEVE